METTTSEDSLTASSEKDSSLTSAFCNRFGFPLVNATKLTLNKENSGNCSIKMLFKRPSKHLTSSKAFQMNGKDRDNREYTLPMLKVTSNNSFNFNPVQLPSFSSLVGQIGLETNKNIKREKNKTRKRKRVFQNNELSFNSFVKSNDLEKQMNKKKKTSKDLNVSMETNKENTKENNSTSIHDNLTKTMKTRIKQEKQILHKMLKSSKCFKSNTFQIYTQKLCYSKPASPVLDVQVDFKQLCLRLDGKVFNELFGLLTYVCSKYLKDIKQSDRKKITCSTMWNFFYCVQGKRGVRLSTLRKRFLKSNK